MPADPRALAEKVIELAGKATPGPWEYDPHDDCVVGPSECLGEPVLFDCFEASASDGQLAAHAGTHYATIARALIEAQDECDRWKSGAFANFYKVRNDRDALLADLPHALGRCECVREVVARDGRGDPTFGYPEAHTAAVERLEARIK